MALTRAAVVTSFDEPPHYQEFDLPKPGENQALVDVLAVGLHPRVRSSAAGRHYTSTDHLPLIPGVDGVGRMSDGTRVYFAADDALPGPMAEKAVVDTRRMVYLSQEADAIKVAAAMNPAMSSWVAFRRRVPIERGQGVLVLGATGNAGTMAVRVAKRLGAGRVVGAGRDTQRLKGLMDVGADEIVALAEDTGATARSLGKAAAEVDIVIDYLWGAPAEKAIMAPAERPIGPQPGTELDPDWCRGRTDLESSVCGLAIGEHPNPRSWSRSHLGRGYLAELPALIDEIDSGRLEVKSRPVPLREIETVWIKQEVPGERIVVVP